MTTKTRRRCHECYAHLPLGIWLLLAPWIMTSGNIANSAFVLLGGALLLILADYLYQEFDREFFANLVQYRV